MPLNNLSAYSNMLLPGDRDSAKRNAMISAGLGLIGNREGLGGIAPILQQGFGTFNNNIREQIEARLLQQDVARQQEQDARRREQDERSRITFEQGQEDRASEQESLKQLQEQLFEDEQARSEFIGQYKARLAETPYGADPVLNQLIAIADLQASQDDKKSFDSAVKMLVEHEAKLASPDEDPELSISGGLVINKKTGELVQDYRRPTEKETGPSPQDFGPGTKHYLSDESRWLKNEGKILFPGVANEQGDIRQRDIDLEDAKTHYSSIYWEERTPFGSNPNLGGEVGGGLSFDDSDIAEIQAAIDAGEFKDAADIRAQLPGLPEEAIARLTFPNAVEVEPLDLSHIGSGGGGKRLPIDLSHLG